MGKEPLFSFAQWHPTCVRQTFLTEIRRKQHGMSGREKCQEFPARSFFILTDALSEIRRQFAALCHYRNPSRRDWHFQSYKK